MSQPNNNKSQAQIHSEHEAESLYAFYHSNGWRVAKERLVDILKAQMDISTLDTSDAEKMLEDIKVRQRAEKLVNIWVEQIENEVSQYTNMVKSKQEDEIISHFE